MTPKDGMTFGQALRAYRLDKDPPWSKKRLAVESGVSPSLITRLENDENVPLDTTVERLARGLRIPRADLEQFLPARSVA